MWGDIVRFTSEPVERILYTIEEGSKSAYDKRGELKSPLLICQSRLSTIVDIPQYTEEDL